MQKELTPKQRAVGIKYANQMQRTLRNLATLRSMMFSKKYHDLRRALDEPTFIEYLYNDWDEFLKDLRDLESLRTGK